MFEVSDIYKTSVCPLAKVMRRECKKRGIDSLKVVYSREEPRKTPDDMSRLEQNPACDPDDDGRSSRRRSIPGSVAFVPSVVGLIIAGEVINDLTGISYSYIY